MMAESCVEEFYVNAKKVVKIDECSKTMKTLFLAKSIHWHKNETNCKKNEVVKKQRRFLK